MDAKKTFQVLHQLILNLGWSSFKGELLSSWSWEAGEGEKVKMNAAKHRSDPGGFYSVCRRTRTLEKIHFLKKATLRWF